MTQGKLLKQVVTAIETGIKKKNPQQIQCRYIENWQNNPILFYMLYPATYSALSTLALYPMYDLFQTDVYSFDNDAD